jgi:hypothetical protein
MLRELSNVSTIVFSIPSGDTMTNVIPKAIAINCNIVKYNLGFLFVHVAF